MTAEHDRLAATTAAQADWKHWGPYLSERAWGTVREDYSANGDAWEHFTHDQARSRAYRWNEDGMAGVCDGKQLICLGMALWNERDPILKERFFGLTGKEGNHGEDVKEYYFYLDNTPTHASMKMLYKYPQVAYPYDQLVAENLRRGYHNPEYELLDALHDAFLQQRYFDIVVEYAKASPEDIICRISATNRGPDAAPLRILPQIWFRNIWDWDFNVPRPAFQALDTSGKPFAAAHTTHSELGERWWYVKAGDTVPELLFTENETNTQRLFGTPNRSPFVKDGFHQAIVENRRDCVNPARTGSKVAAHIATTIAPGATYSVLIRFSNQAFDDPFSGCEELIQQRKQEADAFYETIHRPGLSEDERRIQRQAFAGMLWSKQCYFFDVDRWLAGDPTQPPPPPERKNGRNHEWRHLNNADVISMPDKWEYPWYASWDLAFHCVPLAMIDPDFAKNQLILLGYEWYQHPNGQIPAYEWNFSDTNPPVLAWSAWRVYQIERNLRGKGDVKFLERVFHKLLLNFVWWVNRKDDEGNNIFSGGFLGLDNIGVFDRSAGLPYGGHIEQSDGTSWMGMFALNMMAISVELAGFDEIYEDMATKFFEHFLYIAEAMNKVGGDFSLWDDEDGFFYDVLGLSNGQHMPLRVHSMVGLIPLFAVAVLEPEAIAKLPNFAFRLEWFFQNRPELAKLVSRWPEPGRGYSRLMAIVRGHRMKRILRRMLDEKEFFSDYGIRALSRYHLDNPYIFSTEGQRQEVRYLPAESDNGLFGGNSNWRGPIWMPVNYLIIEGLREFHSYYGDDFRVECPTGSGIYRSLGEVAAELGRRLVSIFMRNETNNGRRAVLGGNDYFQNDPQWRDYIPFYEYFHGDNGAGIGASHQTGWTGLVAALINECGGATPPATNKE